MLYVHVPFCRGKCAYCDFYSTPRLEWMDAYATAVANECALRAQPGFEPRTLYFGGGTPSSLPTGVLDRLLSSLPLPSTLREATIEANPEDVTPGWAAHIVSATPFTRVSMGVQTFDDTQLRFIGRRHTASDAMRAVDTLRAAGLTNLSLDLIYGLPGQTLESWQQSLDTMLRIRPQHISAYLLSYEPRTRLGAMLSRGKVSEAPEELVERMYSYLCHATREAGYEHYEISNFALPGCRAIHNSGYWDGTPYLGLGPGAHSCYGGVRGYTPADLKNYIASEGRGIYVEEEESEASRFNDMIITGLRTSDGIDVAQLTGMFAHETTADFTAAIPRLTATGDLVTTDAGRLRIAEDRWLTSNAILLDMIAV